MSDRLPRRFTEETWIRGEYGWMPAGNLGFLEIEQVEHPDAGTLWLVIAYTTAGAAMTLSTKTSEAEARESMDGLYRQLSAAPLPPAAAFTFDPPQEKEPPP